MAKYANLVGSIAYNIVGDVHVAGDITQDTFLKVFRNLRNLDDPKRFKGWLCSIVRTTCVDFLRKERVRPTSLEKITDEGLEPEGEFLGTVFKQTSTELEELREKVLHVVNALPKIYQQIILLRHLRKMTYREMGDFLGLPVATIESRPRRSPSRKSSSCPASSRPFSSRRPPCSSWAWWPSSAAPIVAK